MTLALLLAAAVATSPAQLLEGYRAAWDRADATALGGFYASEGELATPYGVRARGRAAVAAFYRTAFQHGYGGSRGEARLDELRAIGPGLVIARGRWAIHGARDEAGAARPAECGELAAVLRRETGSGGWRILVLHEFAGTCPAAP